MQANLASLRQYFSTTVRWMQHAMRHPRRALRGPQPTLREVLQRAGIPSVNDAEFDTRDAAPMVAMSTLGTNGRFANQLFQYLYLSIVAERHGAVVHVPRWAGTDLYGLIDPAPRDASNLDRYHELDAAQTTRASLRGLSPDALFDSQIKATDIDYWGYFQLHGRLLAPYRDHARRIFTLVPAIEQHIATALARLESHGSHLAAVHLRRGDYGYDCFFRAPCSWYAEWLRAQPLDRASTVVYIASETPHQYRQRFAPYRTVSARDVSTLPPALDWLLDFEVMRRAHTLAIANSSFSYFAAFLNERCVRYARPSVEAMQLVEFDPLNAPVIFTNMVPKEVHQQLASLDKK
jgi:hypothetical protein